MFSEERGGRIKPHEQEGISCHVSSVFLSFYAHADACFTTAPMQGAVFDLEQVKLLLSGGS